MNDICPASLDLLQCTVSCGIRSLCHRSILHRSEFDKFFLGNIVVGPRINTKHIRTGFLTKKGANVDIQESINL